MKTTKIFLFILLSFFFVSINSASATDASGSVTVTVEPAPVDCVGSWSACSGGSQTYSISTYAANGGSSCPAYNGQTQGCGTDGYWSGWSPASCPSACGTAASNQTRSCIGPYGGGADCSGSSTSYCSATADCPVNCVGGWGSCSGGSQTYSISTYAANGGSSCPYTNGLAWACGTPASWSGWSTCSGGTQSGTCTQASGGGAPTCAGLGYSAGTNTQSCGTPASWSGWSTCSGGTQSGTCTQATDGGAPTCRAGLGYIAGINTQSCGVNCIGAWSACSGGVQYYNITTEASGGGASCPYTNGLAWACGANAACGTSNGMSFYVAPTSGYCNAGTYSGISGSGPWSWTCNGIDGGTTASCSASKAVDCVGSWSDTATCSASCGGGVKQQVYTITTSASNGGNACPYVTGATQWGGTSCNAFCCSPLTQSQTIQCSSRNSLWTGTITQTSTKSAYSSCTFGSWVDSSNNCSCAAPSYELQTVSCPTGYTGSITQERDKGAYSACLFGGWYQTYYGCTINSYTVSTSVDAGGSVSPTSRTVNNGSTTTFTITPDSSHLINSVSGCGGSLSGSTYTTGAITGACTVSASFKAMTGTLTPTSPSCVIALNSSSCSTTLSWSTTNPIGTSVVTASGMTDVNGNSGSQAFTVPYSSRLFHLYNNTIELATANATSSCTSGTSWNGSKCASPSGALTASNCTIASGGTGCNTNLVWSTIDPIGTSAVTTPTNITVASANSSSGTPYFVNYPSRIFYLYNNAVEIKNATATASCINGTTWDGAKCAPIIITFSAASTDIAYNTATTLNWSVANATTCTASGGWSGTRATSGSVSTGNLTSRTTFTLSCTGLNGTNGTASVTIIVKSFGTLTASNCTILPAANKCNTTLIWNTYNPLATSAVTTPTNITVLSANSSLGTSYSVNYGTRDFYLYNNGVLLATATARASCEQVWDAPSGVCVTVPTLTSPTSSTISALSAKVGATITSLGIPASISARGVCYSSTMQNPAMENNGNGAICGKDGNNINDGAYTIHLVKILSPNTTYYYRGYATNIAGTGYSPQGSFTTIVLPPEASIVKFKELNDKSQIDYGQSVTLIWDSLNAYYGCTMTSNFAPSTDIISSLDPNTAKNQITLKPTKTIVYTLICSGEGGTSPASQVQIKVGKITPTFNEF